jgi:hypothetical protein
MKRYDLEVDCSTVPANGSMYERVDGEYVLYDDVSSLRASAAEKDARIAELEGRMSAARENLGFLCSADFKEPEGVADKSVWEAFNILDNSILSTPTGAKERIETCLWSEDDGVWETSCDKSFIIEDGSPEDNDMKFCTFCGKHLRAEERE